MYMSSEKKKRLCPFCAEEHADLVINVTDMASCPFYTTPIFRYSSEISHPGPTVDGQLNSFGQNIRISPKLVVYGAQREAQY